METETAGRAAKADEAPSGGALGRFKTRFEAFQRTKLYDLLSAAPLLAWFGFCLAQQLPALVRQIADTDLLTADIPSLAKLASQIATPVFFAVLAALLALRRKPQAKSGGLYPRFAAIAGTNLGVAIVLLPRLELSSALSLIATIIVLCGTVLSIYAALSLGRSLSMFAQARRLVINGPYRVVRHPLYASEAIALVGVTLQYLSPLALTLLALQLVFQLERMKNEERVLASTFPEYRAYMASTSRILPGIY